MTDDDDAVDDDYDGTYQVASSREIEATVARTHTGGSTDDAYDDDDDADGTYTR
jgi:hypothetical protein